MNSTYAVHEQALMPVTGGVSVILVAVSMYILSRKFGQPKEGENFKQKLYIIQSLVSGFLIGQIGGHTTIFVGEFPQTYGYIFLLGGLWLLRLLESIGRGWNPVKGETNHVYRSEEDNDFDINQSTMQQQSFVNLDNVGSKEAAEQEFTIQERRKSFLKRQFMLGFLVVALAIVSIMNGFLMAYRVPEDSALKVSIIVCFIINIIAQSITLFGSAVHAGYHIIEENRWRFIWWTILTFFWIVVVVCSTIPILIGITTFEAAEHINTPYFSSIYLFAVGCLWRLSYYYEKHLYIFRRRKELAIDVLVFTLALAVSATTGFWL